MFDRFTLPARRVIVHSQDEARALQHRYMGTEHFLIGMLREEDGIAAQALAEASISLEAVRRDLDELVGRGGEVPPAGRVPMHPLCYKVLEFSLRESIRLRHAHIGPEHLLLGVISQGEGIGGQIMVRLGADLGRLRLRVLEMMGDPAPAGA